jgi:hypothetical protein
MLRDCVVAEVPENAMWRRDAPPTTVSPTTV